MKHFLLKYNSRFSAAIFYIVATVFLFVLFISADIENGNVCNSIHIDFTNNNDYSFINADKVKEIIKEANLLIEESNNAYLVDIQGVEQQLLKLSHIEDVDVFINNKKELNILIKE